MKNKLSFCLPMLLLLFAPGCEKDKNDLREIDGIVTRDPELRDQLLSYPETVTIDQVSYKLSCEASRDFFPHLICSNGPMPELVPRFLVVTASVLSEDSIYISNQLRLTRFYAIHGNDIWQPSHYSDTTITDNQFVIGRSPQWTTGDSIAVMCHFTGPGQNEFKVKQEHIIILRIE